MCLPRSPPTLRVRTFCIDPGRPVRVGSGEHKCRVTALVLSLRVGAGTQQAVIDHGQVPMKRRFRIRSQMSTTSSRPDGGPAD
jgi:hypothetical protein